MDAYSVQICTTKLCLPMSMEDDTLASVMRTYKVPCDSKIIHIGQIMAAYQNVSCFVFEQSIVFNNASVQNIYSV